MEIDSITSAKKLKFSQGSNYFRQRVMLALLSSRPVKIEEIRSQSDTNVGVLPFEVSFLELLNKISNGTVIKISETGTEVNFIPGVLTGGNVEHTCDLSRPLSYYLEPLLLLAPFCKKPVNVTLKGRLQNDANGYNSVYKIKHAALPIMEHFGLEPELNVTSRSYESSTLIFKCTVKKQLLTLRNQLNEGCGKVKKVRGLVYGFRVSPQLLARIVTSAKGVFIPFLSDVFITSDVVKRAKSKVPGFGLCLYAETTKNIVYAADGFVGRDTTDTSASVASVELDPSYKLQSGTEEKKRKFTLFGDEDEEKSDVPFKKLKKEESTASIIDGTKDVKKKSNELMTPEEFGNKIAKELLREIATKSCVDPVYQWLVLGLMALGPKDVSSVILGSLTPFTVQFLRDLRTFFSVTFRVEKYKPGSGKDEEDEESEDTDQISADLLKLSCLGTGYINLNKTRI